MKRLWVLLLCILMLGSVLAAPVSALDYYVSHYEENIYAGGVVDLYAYPSVGDPEDYTYQWQYDAGFGGNSSWHDVPENDSYSGGKTNHLQIHTSTGNYDGWEAIPFQCVVTASDGTVRKTNNINAEIYPTDKLIPNMKNWGYGLYEPNIKNAINLYTNDDVNYTASTYAGAKLKIFCGHKSIDDKPVLRKSEVDLAIEIHITENGHTTISNNNTSYIPYTVGTLQVTFKEKLTIGEYDLGYFDSNTVNVTVSKPNALYTGQAKSACSLLRYTYNESQKLASIPKGTTLEIIGTEGNYYQVYYNGFVGYVGKSLISSTADATSQLIKEVDVTIPRPVAGQKPSGTCTVETASCTLYHTDPVTWTDESGKIVKSTDKFQEGKRYTVSIWLSAKPGYAFQTDASGNPKLGAAINGDLPPYIYKAYEQDPKQVIELVYTFGYTPAAEPTTTPTTPTTPSHTHTPSGWRTTEAYHYKVCTACEEMLTQEDHTGGTVSCKEPALCAVCGYAYKEPTESHFPEGKWTACGDLYHAHLCQICGAHCDPQDHVPGPAATETTPQTCKDCGYILEPAKNHTHSLNKVDGLKATCTQAGYLEYYTCSGCELWFSDSQGQNIIQREAVVIPATGHTEDTIWHYDPDNHWKDCAVCYVRLQELSGGHTAENHCEICGYDQSIFVPEEPTAIEPAESEETTQPTQQEEKTEPAGIKWQLIIPIIAAVCLAGAAVVVILLQKKK